jgi:YggT family protein
MRGLMNILGGLSSLYMILIFIRIMLTWFSGISSNRAVALLEGITDPYLNWFRRFTGLRVASLDLSPIAAIAVLSVVNTIFVTIGRQGRISLGFILAIILSALWSALSFALGFCTIVLGLRLIAYITNQNVYGSFWRIVDTISQPIRYRVERIIFRGRLVHLQTGLITSTAVLLILWIGLGMILRLGINLLAQLPV